MATPQGRRLGYHTPEQVSNQEPLDARPCVLTTTLLGGVLLQKIVEAVAAAENSGSICLYKAPWKVRCVLARWCCPMG